MFTEQYSHRNAGENTSILRVRPFYSYYTSKRLRDCVWWTSEHSFDSRCHFIGAICGPQVSPASCCLHSEAAWGLKQFWMSFSFMFCTFGWPCHTIQQIWRFVMICVDNLHLARRHSPRRRSRLSLRRCAVKTPHSGLCCVAWQRGIYKRSTQLWEKTLKQQLNLYSFTCCLESRQSKQQKGMWIINTKMRPKIPFAYNKTCANRNHIFDF